MSDTDSDYCKEFYCAVQGCEKRKYAFKSKILVRQHYSRFHNLKPQKYPSILSKPLAKSKKNVESDSEEEIERQSKKVKKEKDDSDDQELKKALKELETLKAKVNREKAVEEAVKNLAATKESLQKEAKLEQFHEALKKEEELVIIRNQFYERTVDRLIQQVNAVRTVQEDEDDAAELIYKILEDDGHLCSNNINSKERRDAYIDLLQGLLNHHINPYLQDLETRAIQSVEMNKNRTHKFIAENGGFCDLQQSLMNYALNVTSKTIYKDYRFADLYMAYLKHAMDFNHEGKRNFEVLKGFLDAKLETAKKASLAAN